MDNIRNYLREKKILPENDATAERIARQFKRYAMVDGDLYRRGTDGVFLQCISREEGGELLADIHESERGSHSSSRTLVGKAFRQGFYWPTALQNQPNWLGAAGRASSMQSRYTNQHRHSTPFLCHGHLRSGGLDILGPFPKAIGVMNGCTWRSTCLRSGRRQLQS